MHSVSHGRWVHLGNLQFIHAIHLQSRRPQQPDPQQQWCNHRQQWQQSSCTRPQALETRRRHSIAQLQATEHPHPQKETHQLQRTTLAPQIQQRAPRPEQNPPQNASPPTVTRTLCLHLRRKLLTPGGGPLHLIQNRRTVNTASTGYQTTGSYHASKGQPASIKKTQQWSNWPHHQFKVQKMENT